MTDLENDAQDACAQAVQQYGFVPRRRGILLQRQAGKDVTGWLGLNLATSRLPEGLQINPVVGVRHVALEKALVELAGWKAPVPSVSRPLGYLMPENKFGQWDFDRGDLGATAADLAAAVSRYGQPFIDKWSDWKTFAGEVAEAGLLLDAQKFCVLPLVAVLNDDVRLAQALVAEEVDRIGAAADMYSRAYRAFAQKLTERSFVVA